MLVVEIFNGCPWDILLVSWRYFIGCPRDILLVFWRYFIGVREIFDACNGDI